MPWESRTSCSEGAPAHPLQHDFIGRYRFGAELAAGGTSTVHLGRLLGSAGFHRPVAIKRLHPQYARDPNFVAMLLDEARLVTRVRHPNIVAALDVVMRGGEVFVVMEYVHGQSLAQLVAGGRRLPAAIAVDIVRDTLRGLHAAHDACTEHGQTLNIVHRDVSPQNVLVGTDGYGRIIDFGIAKAEDRIQHTLPGQLKGKLSYMAPEQFADEALDRRTDVWSASVVLWELLTGRRLFHGAHAADVVTAVLGGEIPPPSSIAGSPAVLDAIVRRGLSRRRELRPASAEEMAEELRRALPAAGPTAVGAWVKEAAAPWLLSCAAKLEQVGDGAREPAPRRDSSVQMRLHALGVGRTTAAPSPGLMGVRTTRRDDVHPDAVTSIDGTRPAPDPRASHASQEAS